MAAPAFDPLIDFDGLWTTKLAEQFLPDPRLPAARYECVNGRLVVQYFMRIEIVRRLRHASVELLKLQGGGYATLASAVAGQAFEVTEPFPMRFDPAQLLPGLAGSSGA